MSDKTFISGKLGVKNAWSALVAGAVLSVGAGFAMAPSANAFALDSHDAGVAGKNRVGGGSGSIADNGQKTGNPNCGNKGKGNTKTNSNSGNCHSEPGGAGDETGNPAEPGGAGDETGNPAEPDGTGSTDGKDGVDGKDGKDGVVIIVAPPLPADGDQPEAADPSESPAPAHKAKEAKKVKESKSKKAGLAHVGEGESSLPMGLLVLAGGLSAIGVAAGRRRS